MNRDEMIEEAVYAYRDALYGGGDYPALDELPEFTQNAFRKCMAVALAAAGVELPPEPLPVGTRKRSPKGVEAVLTADDDETSWLCYHRGGGDYHHGTGRWLADAEVADWEIITDVPEGHVTIDLSRREVGIIKAWANGPQGPLASAARAELIRRGETA